VKTLDPFVADDSAGDLARVSHSVSVDFQTPAALLADTSLAAEWDALTAQLSEPNPFGERWYLTAALAALPTDSIRIAVVRDGGGLLGIIPLVRQTHYAGLPLSHLQNWLNHNAFLGTPLIRKGAEATFWQALLAQLDTERDAGLFLHLSGLTDNGPVVGALEATCRKAGRRFAKVYHEERALLEHGLSPVAYWEANVRGKKRKELRRQHKRLAEEGILTFARTDGSADLDQWIANFLTLEKAGWKGANGSALDCSPATRTLFHGVLHGAANAKKLELLTLCLNDRPIAMLANFLTPPGAFSFKTAFDEDYARFSPGVLLQFENLALLGRDDINWCDSCAAKDHPMIDSLWSGRRAIGRYSIAIGGPVKRAAFAALLAAEKAKAKLRGNATS
jgi:CelD/BcsL family acetyltransferase involved in cellulose biosynthesis